MTLSARNVFEGTVTHLHRGPVSAEVTLQLATGESVVAAITERSVGDLGLAVGQPAVAIIKAPLVMLASGTPAYRYSARNQFNGVVDSVALGTVSASVVVRLPGGARLTSVVTHAAVDEMALAPGQAATAFFKASSVVLGVPN